MKSTPRKVSLTIYKQNPKDRTPPPSFADSVNRRQKARSAGMHPDYWYPVEWAKNLKVGKVIETEFWHRSIAVYRGEDGVVRAMENRCAHRQLKLSGGQVNGCNLTCPYHGWQFDGTGKCAHIPHDLFDSVMPEFRVASYPVQEKHGLIWIFPGDPELANTRRPPEIPELAGQDPWGSIPVDFVTKGHHSMIIDNVSDFTHAYLHRQYRPFVDAKLTQLETVGDTVFVEYDTKVGTGKISGMFVNRKSANTDHMKLAYEYPYQRSNTDDQIKHWCFVLPMNESTTRTFYIFYFAPTLLQLPFLPLKLPGAFVRNVIMPISKRVLVKPLLFEDNLAVEAEQLGWEEHHDQPIAELNPAVRQFQDLTIRKWEEYLAKSGQLAQPAADRLASRGELQS